MSFNQGYLDDPAKVGSGERYGSTGIDLAFDTFEDGLLVGRFAKFDTGSLDNMDASVSPVIAGVVLRNVASPVEDAAAIDSSLYSSVDARRSGLVTVDVVDGDTPAKFGAVFANNVAGADAGKATTTDDADTEATGAEFIQEVKANVWLVRLV